MYMEIQVTQIKHRLSKVYDIALDGLTTQGDHHKQWFLEEIVKTIVGEANYSRIWEDFNEAAEGDELWEPGIAP